MKITIHLPKKQNPNLRKLRRWGDPVMVEWGYDYNIVGTSNWQNIALYNELTGWGAVSNFLYVDRVWIDYMLSIQVPDVTYPQGSPIYHTAEDKMKWLCRDKGSIYFDAGSWPLAPWIKWGTTAIGGNHVTIDELQLMTVPDKRPGFEGKKILLEMARLKCFRKIDFARPLEDLLEEGIVHRCYCVYKNNGFGDTPKGAIYSPLWSPLDWDFAGTAQPDSFWLPTAWME